MLSAVSPLLFLLSPLVSSPLPIPITPPPTLLAIPVLPVLTLTSLPLHPNHRIFNPYPHLLDSFLFSLHNPNNLISFSKPMKPNQSPKSPIKTSIFIITPSLTPSLFLFPLSIPKTLTSHPSLKTSPLLYPLPNPTYH